MIRPTEDRVVILPEPEYVEVDSGLTVPTTWKDANRGVVVAVGPGEHSGIPDWPHPLPFKVGDWVAYRRFGALELKDQGVRYLVIGARDILAIIDESVTVPEVSSVPGVDVEWRKAGA